MVTVDRLACEANGVCESIAPEVFHLDADDTLHILLPAPPEALRAKVESAVRRCPRRALSLVEG